MTQPPPLLSRWSALCALALLLPQPINALGASPDEPVRNIVFGSCLNKTDHPMLDRTLTLPMDLFVFLGDNVYADTTDMQVMRAKYDALKESRFFQGLRKKATILATWDDHDFGENDAGAEYSMRREAREEFFRWIEEPADSPRRERQGIYDSRIFGPEGKRTQVILLDTRYNRGPLRKADKTEEKLAGGPYRPGTDSAVTMLGEAQWRWLAEELKKPAEVRLIASSIQFVSEFSGGEAWANLPHEKRRMLELLHASQAKGVLFISGDRHWSELSRLESPTSYPLYELTASAMTVPHPRGTPTPNTYRAIPATYHQENVGQLQIDWDAPDPVLTFKLIDVAGEPRIEQRILLSALQPPAASAATGEQGWQQLFNGRDLEGWGQVGSARWRVEDGVIVGGQDGDPKRSGLLTTPGKYRDFELKLDFMIDEHGKYNSGVYLRNNQGTASRTGYQVNIGRGAAKEYSGGIFTEDWLAKGDEQDTIRRELAWNTLHITARGGHIQVQLNGVKVSDYQDPNPSPTLLQEGVIGFQTYGADGHAGWVKFRNLAIREL